MTMILLDAAGLAAARPGKPLFRDVSLTLATGDRLALVGINGCGKSTLLRMLAGTAEPEAGSVRRGRGARVVLLDQVAALPDGTVRQAVGEGWEVESIIDRLGMTGFLDADVATLSGGQAKRTALARVLNELGPPGQSDDDSILLILDEPTNHLDIDAVAWLEERLAVHRGGLIMVTHDRHVLDRVCTRILELDRGTAYLHDGGYTGYLEAKAEREAQAVGAEAVRRNLAKTELAWLRRGAPARTRKPKARIEAATALVEGRAQAAARTGDLDLTLGTPRLGDKVVEAKGVGHRFGDGPWLFQGVDLALDRRERLGIVGPNGAGKSTLLDILAGRIEPTDGMVERGTTVVLGLFDQRGPDLDPKVRARQAVAGPHRQPDWEDARFLERFWFDDDAQWAPVGLLSGGERRRLQLVITLAAKPNVLFLDEPTNDLDLDTLRVLEDFLDDWPGAVVVVSHDRAFLERTVTDVVVIDEHHDAERVAGGYAAWEESRRRNRTSGSTKSGSKSSGSKSSGSKSSGSGRGPGGPNGSAGSMGAPGSAGTRGDGGAAAPSKPRRSASTLRQLIKEAEKELRKLEKRRTVLHDGLVKAAADSDHEALTRLGIELAETDAAVAEVEDRWLELSDEAGT